MRPHTLVPILLATSLLLVTALPLEAQRRRAVRSAPSPVNVRALPVKSTTVPMRVLDMELPDYRLENRSITVTLTLVDDGRGGLGYGAARAGFAGGWGPGWDDAIGNYVTPSVRKRLLQYRNAELQRLRRAVEAAFDDRRTRATIGRALTAAVGGAPHRVGSIVSVETASSLRGGEPQLAIRYR